MQFKLLILFVIQLLLVSNLWAKNLGAHTHGVVSLDMATEKNELLVMLNSPAESFLGFEYRPKTKLEKEKIKAAKDDWNKKILSFLGAKNLSDCKILNSSWKQEFGSKNHSSIIAESNIKCKKSLKGRSLKVSFKERYANIKKINLQLIREDGSVKSETYKKATFTVDL